ncbi:unnamed protein product [Effrenium voratum]|nr:unnamed protein product [Effrenium voratum]
MELECPCDLGDCPEDIRATSAYTIGGGCAFLAVALALLSLQAVPNLHYGIRYNNAQKWADIDNVYTSGRYFIGPWNSFVLFPALVQNVEFSNAFALAASGNRYPALHTRTKEGLALNLEVALQYKLRQQDVGKLYTEFNVDSESFFVSTIRDTLIKVAADYEAHHLWDQRKQVDGKMLPVSKSCLICFRNFKVGDQMQREVNTVLNRTYAECWGLQLLDIALPKAFDESIVMTQVQNQAIATEKFAQESAQIRAVTHVIESKFDKDIKVISASGEANYTLITKTAKANAKKLVLDTEATVLKKIKDELHLLNENLVLYQKYASLPAMSNASLFYGLGSAQVLVDAREGASLLPQGRELRAEL